MGQFLAGSIYTRCCKVPEIIVVYGWVEASGDREPHRPARLPRLRSGPDVDSSGILLSSLQKLSGVSHGPVSLRRIGTGMPLACVALILRTFHGGGSPLESGQDLGTVETLSCGRPRS